MIDHATSALARQSRPVCERVFVDGFSASGMFANRFALLHPERVQAVAVGAPGGWPMAPVASYQGEALSYPVGSHDYEIVSGRPLPLEALRGVPMLFYLGREDTNDSVAYADSYDADQRSQVMRIFGEDPVTRWPKAEALYQDLSVTFRLHAGAGHGVNAAMREELHQFFERHDDRLTCGR